MFTSKPIELFYLFFEGIMLFQVVFFGMIYLISKRRDVLYYSLLNLVSAAYFFLNAPGTFLGIDESIVFNSPSYLYVNFAIFMSMFFMYLIFLKEIFNDTLEQYGYVKRMYTVTLYAIPLLYFLFVLFAFLGWKTNGIFYAGHLINGPFCTLVLLLNFRKKGYKSLIIYGMMVIFVCVVSTIILTVRYNAGSNETILDKYPLAMIKLGMLIDILLFQLALLRRWNEQEKQLAVEKLHSQLEVEKLRNKISGELHDDIGSTLSGIAMYSHMTDGQLQNGNYKRAKDSVTIIQKSANELVGKLSDLVWAINPHHESFTAMLEKIEHYGEEMCLAKEISFAANFNPSVVNLQLPMESRLQIYLILKEAINNAVKYSNASSLKLNMEIAEGKLLISIDDNGEGFDVATAALGNGIENMQKRAVEIDANFEIKSENGKGTLVELAVDLPQ